MLGWGRLKLGQTENYRLNLRFLLGLIQGGKLACGTPRNALERFAFPLFRKSLLLLTSGPPVGTAMIRITWRRGSC